MASCIRPSTCARPIPPAIWTTCPRRRVGCQGSGPSPTASPSAGIMRVPPSAAGVRRIGLVDFDVVDFSNLQRQVLHGTSDVGRSKLQSAKDRLHDINPDVQVDLYETRLNAGNALAIIEPYDLVIDGTDNF